MRPLLSTAIEITVLNSPSLFPFDPNFVTNFPLSSNTRTLMFEVSQTIRCQDCLVNWQMTKVNELPIPLPLISKFLQKITVSSKHFDTIFVCIWHYQIFVILYVVRGEGKRTLIPEFTWVMTIRRKDLFKIDLLYLSATIILPILSTDKPWG